MTSKSDRVALSVPGKAAWRGSSSCRRSKPKKIPDIVKYEAQQQIPFSLEDVVWDYQQLTGGSEEEGFALETEVGMFAMKRDQVARALKPLEDAGIEVDFIQLAPLALYNFVVFDRLNNLEDGVTTREPAPFDGGAVAGHRHDGPGDHQRLPRVAAEHSASAAATLPRR